MPEPATGGGRVDRLLLLGLLAITAALYLLLAEVPLYGDAWSYGYRSAEWMSENGLQPIPAGSERGQQAMGHPPLFFWLWAVLMSVVGGGVRTAHILPAVSSFFALWGTYRLTLHLARCRTTAMLATAGVLAGPVFLAASMNPMPDVAVAAAAAWCILFYSRGRFAAAALTAALAVALREQAVVLPATLACVEVLHGGWRHPGRVLLLLAPAAVLALNGMAYMLVNGYFFYGAHLGEGQAVSPGVLVSRFREFYGFLYAGGWRWLPVTVAGALMAGRRRSVPFALLLLSPALLYPPGRVLWIGAMIAAAGAGLLRRGMPARGPAAVLAFPAAIALFFVLVVMVSPSPLDLYRYLLIAVPTVTAGALAALRRSGGRRLTLIIGLLFAALALGANRKASLAKQPESNLAWMRGPLLFREAVGYAALTGDTLLVSARHLEKLGEPDLGYVEEPVPARDIESGLTPGVSYAAVVEQLSPLEIALADRLEARLGEDDRVELDSLFSRGDFEVKVYRVLSPASATGPR